MKKLFGGLMAPAFPGLGVQEAAAVDKVVITSQKKSVNAVRGNVGEGGTRAKDSTTFCYELKLQNQTLADLAQLTVNYLIFVERPKLGSRLDQPSPVNRISGTQAVAVLSNRTPQSVATSSPCIRKISSATGSTAMAGAFARKTASSVSGYAFRKTAKSSPNMPPPQP
jgi:hypothetical protein